MENRIEKAFVSFRVGTPQWMPEARFAQLLSRLESHAGVTDEISFFTSETHPPLPIPEVRRRAEILSGRMALTREHGLGAGINILATIGHHEENLPHSLTGDFVRMTDIDGSICRGSLCPNDERVRTYVRELYAVIAAARPDFIWIDDDVRLMGHMPIRCGCFCDECLRLFSERMGTRYTRERLRGELDLGDAASKLAVRKAWLEHNRSTIARLMTLIEQAVHAERPGLPIGFMTGERSFEGYGFDGIAAILSGSGMAPVRWRPGGGFYTDQNLDLLAGKSHEIGRQVSLLPPEVICIQSEIENFPYQRLKKAARTTALEAASHIAAGCTGAAFNVISMYDEPLDEYDSLLAELARTRPFLDQLARAFQRDPPRGLFCAWGKDSFAASNLRRGSWVGDGDAPLSMGFGEELCQIGLPPAYAPGGACITAFAGDTLLAMDEASLRAAFSGGVYMDARALECLHQRGMGALAGFVVDGWRDADCIEELTAHPLNGAFGGRKRDGRQSFWKSPAGILRPLGAGTRALARIVDYAGAEVSACGMGIFENDRGGRVCVAAYCPWTFHQSLSKSAQMKALARWLSRDTLPLLVESFHRANVWVRDGARPSPSGGATPSGSSLRFALANACLDDARGLTLLIATTAKELRIFAPGRGETRIAQGGADGPYRRFTLPTLEAWEMVLGICVDASKG